MLSALALKVVAGTYLLHAHKHINHRSPLAQGVGNKVPETKTTVHNQMECLELTMKKVQTGERLGHQPTGRGMQATRMGLVSLALAGPRKFALYTKPISSVQSLVFTAGDLQCWCTSIFFFVFLLSPPFFLF